MNSVMGCLADCAELLPNDSYYSEYCGGPLGGQGEAASDTAGRSNYQRGRSGDAPDIWDEGRTAQTGQRGRSGSETGQGTDERFDVDLSRLCQQSPTASICMASSSNAREAAWNAGKQQATRPRLPPKDLPAAAKRAADAAKRAAKAFALAEEAARAAKAAEETADRAVRAAESAAEGKKGRRGMIHRHDPPRVPCDEAPEVDSDGSRAKSRLTYSCDPSGPIITMPVIQHSPPTTIEEGDEEEDSDRLDVLGRMDSAAESDGGRDLHTFSSDGNISGVSRVASKTGRSSIMSMSSVKSIAYSSPIFDISSNRKRAVSSSASLGTERREKRAVSVELSEVSDSDLSAVVVGSLAATSSLVEDPTATEAIASGDGDGDVGGDRAPARCQRDWDVESSNGEGGSAADGVRKAKSKEEVGWHGRMHERAASMGEQWRQLAQPNIELESKLSSLSTDSSATESAIDPDSLTAGTPTGITTAEDAGRARRIWPVSPEGREEPRAGLAVKPIDEWIHGQRRRCEYVTTHLRNIELSPDGTVLTIRPEDGGAQMDFTLDDLLEVKENLPEETVTLVSRHVNISIAFEGQAMALQQFSSTLMPVVTEAAKDKEKHSAELPAGVVLDDKARELVLPQEDIDSDDEDLPISHPERLTPSSSIAGVSTHTNRTRASTGSKSMWHADSIDKAPETSAVPWDTLTASPVVSISSTTSSNTWGRSGASKATSTSRQREAFQALPKADHEWEMELGGDKFESLREMPSRSPRSLLSSAQSYAEREERRQKARSLRLERRQLQQRKGRKSGSAPIERLSFDAVSLSEMNPTEEDVEATICKADKLLRDARKARTQARVRSQEEGVFSRLESSTGAASESNNSDVTAVPAPEVDEREVDLVIEEKPSLSDAGEDMADRAVDDCAHDDNRHGTGGTLADKK